MGGGDIGRPVFVGTVLSVIDLPRKPGELEFLSSRSAKFRIDESFGGVPEGLREIEIWTGSGGGDCGIGFRVGDTFLVNAYTGKDGFARTGICSGTRRLDYAGVALENLRARKAGKPMPSLTGRLAQQDRDFRGRISRHKPKLLANTLERVKAANGGKVYETRSDAQGLYAFYDLPPGVYELAPELPPGTQLSRYVGGDRAAALVSVAASQCLEHNLDVFSSGSVQGRVLDSSGKLASYSLVYIVPEDQEIADSRRDMLLGKPG
jgi:hypothetical protein